MYTKLERKRDNAYKCIKRIESKKTTTSAISSQTDCKKGKESALTAREVRRSYSGVAPARNPKVMDLRYYPISP